MSKKLLSLAMGFVVALCLSAAAQECPRDCVASFTQTFTSGSLAPTDVLIVTPSNVTDGSGALVGGGGGIVCSTCDACTMDLTISWNFTSTGCLAYNHCSLLGATPGSGSIGPVPISRMCGQSSNSRVDFGNCNSSCPWAFPASYTVIYTFNCTTCQ